MEHAELLVKSFTDVKNILLNNNNAYTWIKLFFLIFIPLAIGITVMTIISQFILLPVLTPILVNSGRFGFTDAGLSYMLLILGVALGFVFLFIVPLFQGFLYRVIRSDTKASTKNTLGLFFSGWRVNLVCLFYAIPIIIFYAIYALLYMFFSGKITGFAIITAAGNTLFDTIIFVIYLIVQFLTLILVSLFGVISLVHVARGASFKEAFKLKKVVGVIRQIGWYNYILCMVTCTILVLLISVLFLGIGMGFEGAIFINIIILVIYFILLIPIALFCTRYLTRVYDVGTQPPEEDTEDFDDF